MLIEEEDRSEQTAREAIVETQENVYYTDYLIIAGDFWLEGELESAYDAYLKAYDLEKNSVEVLTGMAQLQRELRNADKAVEHWQQALVLLENSDDSAKVQRIEQLIELTKQGDFTTSPNSNASLQYPL